MDVLIGFIALSGLLLLAVGGMVAYRWTRDQSAAGSRADRVEWPVSRSEPDTQAGRI